jgi:hypothetical protein
MLLLPLSVLLPLLPLARCSFYDNPELEIPAESGTPLDELKAKWDFDVSVCPPSDGIYRREMGDLGNGLPRQAYRLNVSTVGILRHINLCTPPTREVSHDAI